MTVYLEFKEPERVDKKDNIEDKIAKERGDDKRFPAISIRHRPSKQSEHNGRCTLQHSIVSLDLRHKLLCLLLYLRMVENICTYFLCVVQVDQARLVHVQALCGDTDEAQVDTEHEEDRLK